MISWSVLFGFFIRFIPFYRKSKRHPVSMYIAFIFASAFEMFGIPLSMYFIAWAFGVTLPMGLLWGHTLQQYLGYWGMYIGYFLNLLGGLLIYLGWKAVYTNYWSKERGEGILVIDGIYAYTRHPQYAGFILMTLGLLVHWATIPLLIMWLIMVIQYYKLAKREDRDMEEEFGDEYRAYQKSVPMFMLLPKLNRNGR